MKNTMIRDSDFQALPKVLTEDMLAQFADVLENGTVGLDDLQSALTKEQMIEVISYVLNYAPQYAEAIYDYHYDRESTFTPVKDVDELCRICGLSEEDIAETKVMAANMG